MLTKNEFTLKHLQYIIAVALKSEELFLELKDHVQGEDFHIFAADKDMLDKAAFIEQIWDTAKNYYERHNTLPTPELLEIEFAGRYADHINLPNQQRLLAEFLRLQHKAKVHLPSARYYKQLWFNKAKIMPQIARCERQDISQLPEVLERVTKQAYQYLPIQHKVVSTSELFTRQEDDKEVISTGVPFVDALIGGGCKPGEVATLLGATGSGKTTLGVQIATAVARQEYFSGRNGKSVYFSYEDTGQVIAERAIACAADIPRSRLRTITGPLGESLNTALEPQPYELTRFTGDRESLRGERERFEAAKKWLDDNLIIADFSGRTGQVNTGCHGIPEIVQFLERLNADIRFVIIDWAGLVVRRYLEAKNARDLQSAVIHQLTMFCDNCHRLIAGPFKCPVLVIQQLAGRVNAKSPTTSLTNADAEGCKSFNVNAWHSFTLGTKDRSTNVVRFDCIKTRSDKSYGYRLLYLDGDFGKFEDVSRDYVIEPRTKTIISRSSIIVKNAIRNSILDSIDEA